MPITLQKKKKSKKTTKAQYNEHHHNKSCLSKLFSQIPTTLFFLFLIFLWSTTTTLISDSIVRVCLTSRKLTNNQLYCLSAGSQPSNESFSFVDKVNELPLTSPPLTKGGGTEGQRGSSDPFVSQKIIAPALPPPPPLTSFSTSKVPSKASSIQENGKTKEEVDGGEVFDKEVERQMEILRSYKMKKAVDYTDVDACDGKGIFVYDLPAKFNKELMDSCEFVSNGGFGEPLLQLGKGWYDTHEFALEPIFHARVLKHPCRVKDPEDAKFFYVPFYGGLEILKSHLKDKTSNEIKDKLSHELVEWLEKQRFWKRNFEIDHVFVLGKVSWDFRRGKGATWGNRFLELDDMQNPIKLLIERHPWNSNDIAVPYPTSFHPRSDNDIVAWQTKIMEISRNDLASFIGTSQPNTPTSIRSTVIRQCSSATTSKCKVLNDTEPGPTMRLQMGSEFCLHPSGEGATRKSFFDSLIAGCIPVVFDPFTAHYQYPWHLPVDRSIYSVFIDRKAVLKGEVNVVDRLEAISATRREDMRRYIVYEVMPSLVYAHPEGKFVRFEDAFTVAMNSVIQRMNKVL